MKYRNVFPKSALSADVENFVGTKSDGRNGPLGMDISMQRKRPAARLTLSLPVDQSRKQAASLELFSRQQCYPNSLSCTSWSAVGQGTLFLRFFTAASASTRCMPKTGGGGVAKSRVEIGSLSVSAGSCVWSS